MIVLDDVVMSCVATEVVAEVRWEGLGRQACRSTSNLVRPDNSGFPSKPAHRFGHFQPVLTHAKPTIYHDLRAEDDTPHVGNSPTWRRPPGTVARLPAS